MADYSGRKVKVGIAKEAVRNTWSAPTYWVRWETFDFFDTANTTFNKSAIGVLDQYSGAEITQQWAEGSISGKLTDQTLGILLFGALGSHSVGTTSGETTVYDHTYSESQSNTSQSLSITRVDPNQTLGYALAMVDSFELDVKTGDFVRHTTKFTSQPGATQTATPAYIAENEWKAKNVTVKMATSVGGLSGATAIPLNNLKLTVNKGVTPYYVVGQNNPSEIFSTNVTVTGSFQLRYTDNTYFTPRFNNTVEAIQIKIANTDVTLGSAANPTLTFTLPQCYLNTFKIDNSLDGMVQQTIDFTAAYSIGAGYAIQAVLTNTVATY